MKKIIFTLTIISIATIVKAQWIDNGNNLTTSDNVGVGTSSPNAKLDVVGGTFRVSHASNQRLELSQNMYNDGTAILNNRAAIGHMKFQMSGVDRMIIKRDGNVGIGTVNPESILSISGSGTMGSRFSPDKAYFQLSDGNISMLMDGNEITTNEQLVFGTSFNNDFSFHNINANSNEELLRIKSNGFVGIGASNPFQKLSIVDGQIFLGNTTANKTESGRIRFGEYTNSFQGAFIHYNGNTNIFNIGVHSTNDANTSSDFNSISIRRDNGRVGIGTSETGNHQLAVEGSIGAREIKVEASGWSDFVFENNYNLRTLEEVEEHIIENGHLPEIPSEAEVTENGINLGEMNAKLLQKIEELTLYLIEQNKELKSQQDQNQKQQRLMEQLRKEVSALRNE